MHTEKEKEKYRRFREGKKKESVKRVVAHERGLIRCCVMSLSSSSADSRLSSVWKDIANPSYSALCMPYTGAACLTYSSARDSVRSGTAASARLRRRESPSPRNARRGKSTTASTLGAAGPAARAVRHERAQVFPPLAALAAATSVNRCFSAGGGSRFPTSSPGSWRRTREPRVARDCRAVAALGEHDRADGAQQTPLRRSSVSAGARLISSNKSTGLLSARSRARPPRTRTPAQYRSRARRAGRAVKSRSNARHV